MTIKEAEEQTGLSRSNIRFYEKEGLVKPRRNAGNSYRDYSEKDIGELQKIAYLRTLGISIEDIRRIVERQADLYEIIQKQIPLLERQISELQNARRMCEMLLSQGKIDYEDLQINRYISDPEEYWQKNRQILRLDSIGFISVWGGKTAWILFTAASLLIALCALWFLPEQIPVQWSGGEAVSFADRRTVLAYPAACVVIRFLLRLIIDTRIKRSTLYSSAITDYITNSLCFAALSAEVFMILFVKGIVTHITVILAVECMILVAMLRHARKRLPIG